MWVVLLAVLAASKVLAAPELLAASDLVEAFYFRVPEWGELQWGAPLRCRDVGCRHRRSFRDNEHRYLVDGKELWVTYIPNSRFLRLQCKDASVLKSPAMPRADSELSAWDVNIANCELADGSLADLLAYLNVTMVFDERGNEPRGNLTIDNSPTSQLTTKLFTNLDLVSLHVNSEAGAKMTAEPHFLAPLKGLRSLKLQNVILPAGELVAPRPSLRQLELLQTGIERLPEAVYSSTSLQTLSIVSDVALDAVAVPSGLQSLSLQSPATTLRLDTVPALEDLYITHWTEIQPPPLTQCDSLRKLHLMAPAVHTLPHGWLANCSTLEELVVQNARNLTSLPPKLFGSFHSELSLVSFKEGALETLPVELFQGVPELVTLQLSGNRLKSLPRGTFPWALERLDLSSNDLGSGVLEVVAMAGYRLTTLNLSYNPHLGDACNINDYSPLRQATSLIRLLLHNTNVSRICRDWRETLPLLELLDLTHTSVATLSFEDLQFTQRSRAIVMLKGAPVTLLEMSSDDFKMAKHTPSSGALVVLDARGQLQCDCRMYWTRRVLDNSPHVLDHVNVLRCANGRLLRDVQPEDMVCARPAECVAWRLPAACACAARPDDDPQRSGQLVRVRCERAALPHLPRLPAAEGRLYELLLPYNHITDLHAADLEHVKVLDLRNNSITRVDESTAISLGRLGGMLRLAGNPLECGCSAAPLLQALRSRPLGLTDLKKATCSDGKSLDAVFVVGCSKSLAWLVGILGALLALAVAIIVYLASPKRRFFTKAVLHYWGCTWFAAPEDKERHYDAFVSFSHKDEGVVRELAARLEPPYRLCLHNRNWTPGLRIADQIVDSVNNSYRTLAVVSRHFLASAWVDAEFRAAHAAAMLDGTPRLIVILLEEPAELELDDKMQLYVDSHTCLRWGEPWFYHKLAVVLPRARRPASVMDQSPFIRPSVIRTPAPAAKQKRSRSRERMLTSVVRKPRAALSFALELFVAKHSAPALAYSDQDT